MRLFSPGKDLLIVGFWTDWGYLNDVLAEALNAIPFGSVTVVDPDTSIESSIPATTVMIVISAIRTRISMPAI
jgi:hypothetical protein